MDKFPGMQDGFHLMTDDTQGAQVFQVTQTSPLVYSYNVICMGTRH